MDTSRSSSCCFRGQKDVALLGHGAGLLDIRAAHLASAALIIHASDAGNGSNRSLMKGNGQRKSRSLSLDQTATDCKVRGSAHPPTFASEPPTHKKS